MPRLRLRSLLSPLDMASPPSPPEVVVPQQHHHKNSTNTLNPSILIIALILTLVFLVSVSIRFLNRLCHQSSAPPQLPQTRPLFDRRVSSDAPQSQALIDSLPLFSFDSVASAFQKSAPDCAVCLSRFEPQHQLRLLPACSHAFHSSCIDMWLSTNRTCPLCRSTISIQDCPLPAAVAREESFRIEMGSVSRRGPGSESRRSYSMGSFDYVVDDDLMTEVVVESSRHRRVASECPKEEPQPPPPPPPPPGDNVAEAAGGRGWLKEYVDRLASSASSSFSSSRALSFRLSCRSTGGAATGSSRRSDIPAVAPGGSWDFDSLGLENSNFFRWLVGV